MSSSLPKRTAFAILFCKVAIVTCWKTCPGGSVCPDYNTCCQGNCVTDALKAEIEHNSTSVCCEDDGIGLTGCGSGYRCASASNKHYNVSKVTYFCELRQRQGNEMNVENETGNSDFPKLLPRYVACSLPAETLQHVHGLNIRASKKPFDNIIGSTSTHPNTEDKDDTDNSDDNDDNDNIPQLAYYSTMGSLDSEDRATCLRQSMVQTAFIMVHGSGRTAEDYLCCSVAALPTEFRNPMNSSILVITPKFLAPEDGVVNTTNVHGKPLCWNETDPIPHTWRYGADAIDSNISSYEAMDVLVERIMFDRERFPLLKRVIIAGHSAGGQFVHRFALTSGSPAWGDGTSGRPPRIVPIRAVAANPRSFCYLDSRRYINGTHFGIPDEHSINACPDYNKWEWGLDAGGKLNTPYKDNALKMIGGQKHLVNRYSLRDVIYLAGALDTEPVRAGCEDDDFQGINRKQRSERFFASLEKVYSRQTHRRIVVPSSPHDHCLMFQSKEGRRALFGRFETQGHHTVSVG